MKLIGMMVLLYNITTASTNESDSAKSQTFVKRQFRQNKQPKPHQSEKLTPKTTTSTMPSTTSPNPAFHGSPLQNNLPNYSPSNNLQFQQSQPANYYIPQQQSPQSFINQQQQQMPSSNPFLQFKDPNAYRLLLQLQKQPLNIYSQDQNLDPQFQQLQQPLNVYSPQQSPAPTNYYRLQQKQQPQSYRIALTEQGSLEKRSGDVTTVQPVSNKLMDRMITEHSKDQAERHKMDDEAEGGGGGNVTATYGLVTRSKKNKRALKARHLGGTPGLHFFPGGHQTRLGTELSLPLDVSELCDLRKGRITCDANTHTHFSTISQKCNSFQFGWGKAFDQFSRILPSINNIHQMPTYTVKPQQTNCQNSIADLNRYQWFGVFQKLCSCPNQNTCVQCMPVARPGARYVSNVVHNDIVADSRELTFLNAAFGQFLDHDITLGPEEVEACCPEEEDGDPANPACYNIEIPPNDPFYSQPNTRRTCFKFVRSASCIRSVQGQEQPGTEENINAITSFVDASNVYGSRINETIWLRENDGTGRLKVQSNGLLPEIRGAEATNPVRYRAGDMRVREMAGLTTLHNLFVREHNLIVDALRNHPTVRNDRSNGNRWSDDDLFYNARRILIGIMQKIVYDEWLPLMIGPETLTYFDTQGASLRIPVQHGSSSYAPQISPQIFNSFASAVFRFGHALLVGSVQKSNIRTLTAKNRFQLHRGIRNVSEYEADNGRGMEELLAGIMSQPSRQPSNHMTDEVRNLLFALDEEPTNIGDDLIARNIQRSRDHWLPSYAAYYKKFISGDSSPVMDCWNQRPPEISPRNWALLQQVYHHPHHIDLFAGGMSEDPLPGAALGRLFSRIIAFQFSHLKYGDRHFVTHGDRFSPAEYQEIRSRTLQGVICENTKIERVAPNPFRQHIFHPNQPTPCSQIGSLNVNVFVLRRVPAGLTDD